MQLQLMHAVDQHPVGMQARAAAPQLLLVAPYASHWLNITL